MSTDISPTTEYREPIYIEGGPWKNDCSGRADLGLLKPVNSILLYPGDGCRYEYVRTKRTWQSPMTGETHTVFRFNGLPSYDPHVGKRA